MIVLNYVLGISLMPIPYKFNKKTFIPPE